MADFVKAVTFVLGNEDPTLSGEVVPEPNGGMAKWGINSVFHPGVDVPSLTLDQAKYIYHQEYWNKILGDQLLDQEVATRIMDLGVNTGIENVVKQMQRSVNTLKESNIHCLLATDGVMGPNTLAAINGFADPTDLMNTFKSLMLLYYDQVHLPSTLTAAQRANYVKAWDERLEKPIPA